MLDGAFDATVDETGHEEPEKPDNEEEPEEDAGDAVCIDDPIGEAEHAKEDDDRQRDCRNKDQETLDNIHGFFHGKALWIGRALAHFAHKNESPDKHICV